MAKDNQYNHIYQLWRNERRSIDLLEVKGSMYSTIRQKITQLEKSLEKLDSTDKVSAKILADRIDRLNRILRDMTKIRTHKIIHAIFAGELNKKGLAAEELDLVNSPERNFDEHNKRSIFGEATVDVIADGGIDKTAGTTNNFMIVRILEDIPEIANATTKGEMAKVLGPFKKEDIVKLPLIYAKALIMKNAADRVDLPEL